MVIFMDKKTIAAVLGALGLIFIFAGPAFHYIPIQLGIFLALVCWVVAGLIARLGKGEEKGEVEKVEKEEEKGQ